MYVVSTGQADPGHDVRLAWLSKGRKDRWSTRVALAEGLLASARSHPSARTGDRLGIIRKDGTACLLTYLPR